MFPERIPVQVLHDGGAEKTSVDAAFHEIAFQFGRAGGSPQTDVNSPVPLVVLARGTNPTFVSSSKRRIVHKLMVMHRSQSILVVDRWRRISRFLFTRAHFPIRDSK